MSVTNKPNDGEPIVQRVTDPIMGEKYVPTPVFWRFLDELTRQTNETSTSGTQIDSLVIGMQARLAQVEEQLADNPFTIDTTGVTIDSTLITIDMAKA